MWKRYPLEACPVNSGLANGDHSAHSSNGGSGSSGRSTGRSVGSSGGRRAAPPAGDAAETMAQRGLPGMSALPEDSDVINTQQVSKQLFHHCHPLPPKVASSWQRSL